MEIWQNQTSSLPELPACTYTVDLDHFHNVGMQMAKIISADQPFRELNKHIEKLPSAEQFEAKTKLSKFVSSNSFVSGKCYRDISEVVEIVAIVGDMIADTAPSPSFPYLSLFSHLCLSLSL